MLDRGFAVAGIRLVSAPGRFTPAHIILLAAYVAEIGYLAQRYDNPNLENEFNIACFMIDPAETLYLGIILAFKPFNMDVLPQHPPDGVIPGCVVRDVAAPERDAGLKTRSLNWFLLIDAPY